MNTRRCILKSGILLALAHSSQMVFGQTQPPSVSSNAIRLIIPYDPAGGSDMVARVVAKGLQEELGRSVIPVNRSGAGTRIGSDLVAKSAPDGQTLLFNGLGLTTHPGLYNDLPYDVKKDFAAVSLLGSQPYMLVTGPSMGTRSLADIVTLAKQQPGQLTFGTAGIGSAAHIASEVLWYTMGIKLTHVPYKGTSPAMIDLLGGRLDLVFTTIAPLVGPVKTKQVRALGVGTLSRTAVLPDVPTIAEQGYPGFEFSTWSALYVAAGTPEAIKTRLSQAVAKVLEQSSVISKLDTDGVIATPSSPEVAQRMHLAEVDRWTAVIKRSGITAQ